MHDKLREALTKWGPVMPDELREALESALAAPVAAPREPLIDWEHEARTQDVKVRRMLAERSEMYAYIRELERRTAALPHGAPEPERGEVAARRAAPAYDDSVPSIHETLGAIADEARAAGTPEKG